MLAARMLLLGTAFAAVCVWAGQEEAQSEDAEAEEEQPWLQCAAEPATVGQRSNRLPSMYDSVARRSVQFSSVQEAEASAAKDAPSKEHTE